MKHSLFVRATTLLFALGALVSLVAHASLGCSTTAASRSGVVPPRAYVGTHDGSPSAANTTSTTNADDEKPSLSEPPPMFLGGSKAAPVMARPPSQQANGGK